MLSRRALLLSTPRPRRLVPALARAQTAPSAGPGGASEPQTALRLAAPHASRSTESLRRFTESSSPTAPSASGPESASGSASAWKTGSTSRA